MKNKLWQTDNSSALHPLVEAYTVGNDYILDQQLLGYDIEASKAHASMLLSIGLLAEEEANKLYEALDKLKKEWLAGNFTITRNQEDGHTAIEAYLTEQLGDIGKKIHAARSRNDQALVMMRLYLKDNLKQVESLADELSKAFVLAAEKAGNTPMPGYTHTQKAMPTTVAIWLKSFADGFSDMKKLVASTLAVIDQNPLGSAAGFGVSLGIDREHTTKTLGFAKTQENPMYCGLSRNLFELISVQTLSPLMVLSGKFAQDMMLFTTQEFDYFSLPASFTTGSSIMPHKRNYDLFEVIRGNSSMFGSYAQQIESISGSVGSGYHRDLQLTKGITTHAFKIAKTTLEVLALAVQSIKIHKEKLESSITPEMLSVVEINKLVEKGVPFRDAYTQVKNDIWKVD